MTEGTQNGRRSIIVTLLSDANHLSTRITAGRACVCVCVCVCVPVCVCFTPPRTWSMVVVAVVVAVVAVVVLEPPGQQKWPFYMS